VNATTNADDADDNWDCTPCVTVAGNPHVLDLDWNAAMTARANNDGLTLRVDDIQLGKN
jgi:hypothetical protein